MNAYGCFLAAGILLTGFVLGIAALGALIARRLKVD
jgi:hypothetical protein